MSFSASKANDYFSIFQERAILYKNLKNNAKGTLHDYPNFSKDRAIVTKQRVNDKTKEIERENAILSKKLIDIIQKKRPKSQEKQFYVPKNFLSEKEREIQTENLRIYNHLWNTKPLIITHELKNSWKKTKKYKRNLRSFNKFNQPKQEMNFLNKVSNRNIAMYIQECYLPNKNNVLNITAPNFQLKRPEDRNFCQKNVKNMKGSAEKEKRSSSCEVCNRKRAEEIAKNQNFGPSKPLLDYSMVI